MKRTPMPPRTARLARRTRLKTRRTSKRFAARRDPKYCAWIRTLPCLLAHESPHGGFRNNCAGRVECAHVQSRGAGGDDVGNTVPLCTRHHRQSHEAGAKSFQWFYDIDLSELARSLARRYAQETGA